MFYKGEKIDTSMTPTSDFHGFGDKIRSEILSRIPAKKDGLFVLDVGTGLGSTVSYLSEHLPRGSKVWTIDPSEEILQNVKNTKFGPKGNKNPEVEVEFVQVQAEKLAFKDDFFDVIVSVMVLHHLEDLGAVFKQLFRVLKKGGKLILADYQPEAGRQFEFQRRHHVSDFFNPEDVRNNLLENGNFSQIKINSFEYWYLVDATK